MQNVRAGTTYPPFLVTISTEDNRVGPGHARKLAARLSDAGAPVYFLEDEEGGHGVSDAFRNPELMALRMTFLIDALIPAGKSTH
jgi:prolyl oligopeptidase